MSDRPIDLAKRPPLTAPAPASELVARTSGIGAGTVTADVLSDVLRAVHLTGAIYFDFELTAPWVAEAPPSSQIAATVMPGSQRVVEYHVLAHGTCWAQLHDGDPIQLQEGDLIVFPLGDPHVLSSTPGMRAAPDLKMFARGSTPLPLIYELGGGGDRARVVCGFLGFDERPYNPLLDALPRMIHLPAAAPQGANGWLSTLLQIAIDESRAAKAGGENILSRLSELIFVETVRRYLETLPAAERGWLAGLRDDVVGRALAVMHGQPAEPWTVEALARAVGVSRSVFAERFMEITGHSPMNYLALWRMQLASRLLAGGGHVASVAEAVGYESEAAFSRAFKKLVGQSPAAWRKSVAPPR